MKLFFIFYFILSNTFANFDKQESFFVPNSNLEIALDSSCVQNIELKNRIKQGFENANQKIEQCLLNWKNEQLNETQYEILEFHQNNFNSLITHTKSHKINVTCLDRAGTCGHASGHIHKENQELTINIVNSPSCSDPKIPSTYIHELFHLLGNKYYTHNLAFTSFPDYTIACTYKCINHLSYLNTPNLAEDQNYIKDLCLSKTNPYSIEHIKKFNNFYKRSIYIKNVETPAIEILNSINKESDIYFLKNFTIVYTNKMAQERASILALKSLILNLDNKNNHKVVWFQNWLHTSLENKEWFANQIKPLEEISQIGSEEIISDSSKMFFSSFFRKIPKNFLGNPILSNEVIFRKLISAKIENNQIRIKVNKLIKGYQYFKFKITLEAPLLSKQLFNANSFEIYEGSNDRTINITDDMKHATNIKIEPFIVYANGPGIIESYYQ